MKKQIAVMSFGITFFLLLSIVILGLFMNYMREREVNQQFETMYDEFNSMQTLFLMSETFGEEMTCLAFESKLKQLDTYVWELGEKIDNYRIASEEFAESDYYQRQKRIFNENEVFYFLLMKRLIEKCDMENQIILFFYQNSADCPKCDDQSFILTDINRLDDQEGVKEVAIFSFDMDLDLTTLNILDEYYELSGYPCLVIDEESYCGIRGKEFIMDKICTSKPAMEICSMG